MNLTIWQRTVLECSYYLHQIESLYCVRVERAFHKVNWANTTIYFLGQAVYFFLAKRINLVHITWFDPVNKKVKSQ